MAFSICLFGIEGMIHLSNDAKNLHRNIHKKVQPGHHRH